MSFSDETVPKNVPDQIHLTGKAAMINEEANTLIQTALVNGARSDAQIFSQFEKLLARHQADMIADHAEKEKRSPKR